MKKEIREKAKQLGFNLVGFTAAKVEQHNIKHFNKWLKASCHASMDYMEKSDPRENMDMILPKAGTVITLATNYFHKQAVLPKDHAKIARYAFGRDYHKVIKKRLIKLEKFIADLIPDTITRSFVDTGPVLERAFSAESGLGFIGKNSCLITREFGSWVFLSEIITTIPYKGRKSTAPKDFSICGSCRLCMDACPTKAITAPGQVDARRCLAFHTIENKGQIPRKFHKALKSCKRLFGCDICQEVCPHNSSAKPCKDPDLKNPIAGDHQNLKKLLAIKDDLEFLEQYKGTPLMRAKRNHLQDTAKIIKD